ncbi:ABC transporter permease [Magnetospirillum fulvum]|uniref:Transport permease protein n=1 Tax=Magnetospirillum fulvum TaxID=1082 RepID=A0A1H6H838_MAGFU|nr:ABC transporter permease [Magnetospirillum fulvum]SEH30270.1 lipopolysaccharide transport system permease protein [Magnetospirillum fulvum]
MKEIIIQPPNAFAKIDLVELWAYRSLLKSMVRRRLKAEFDQQYLAYVWAVFRPLLMVLLFSLFRNLSEARMGVDIPYPLYVYGGLILWFFFTEAVQQTATSVKHNAGLIQKVYFPRIISPLSAIIANSASFAITVVPLVLMMVWYGSYPDWRIILLPAVLLQIAVLIFGLGCIFAALGLSGNDWDRFLGFSLYVGLYVSPVIYSPSMLPTNALPYYSVNPLVGTLMAFRASLFHGSPWPQWEWAYSCAFSLIVAVVGLVMFQRAEKHIVDRL